LKNSSLNAFQVLTNPFNSSVQVRWNHPVSGKVLSRLLDITGKEIFKNTLEVISSSTLFLDLTGKSISRGMYVLDISINQEHHVQKLIKQ
jgi:hypothetical protein